MVCVMFTCGNCGSDCGTYRVTLDIRVTYRTGGGEEIGEDSAGRRYLCRLCTLTAETLLGLPAVMSPQLGEGTQLARRACSA
jgi:hypothetical protein